MMCKNCELFTAFSGGLCNHCLDEQGFQCKHPACDNPVKDEGMFCAECHQEAKERTLEARAEDRLMERGF